MRWIEQQQLLQRVRRLVVIQELFLVNSRNALPQRDLLARCGCGFDLEIQVSQ